MLETSQERVKLLKAGISTEKIEQLYLKANNFRMVNIPVLFEAVEVKQENEVEAFFCEIPAEYVNA